MKVSLKRQNRAVHFLASDDSGIEINIDGGPAVGGENKGVRPMALILMSIGGCSAIDVVLILEKMKQPVGDVQIEIEGVRTKDTVPSVFNSIDVHYIVSPQEGETLDTSKVERAVSLSMEKYCSVSRMLEATVGITHRVSITN